MIGCRRWFVGGTKDEHLPHDSATGDGSEEQSWWWAITKGHAEYATPLVIVINV